ncbi:hypothetical protein TNCV_3123891 [Trichonephila clavipes]|nr:hypothetical protein TNCV_3123891 [Trichonephila clavipes]
MQKTGDTHTGKKRDTNIPATRHNNGGAHLNASKSADTPQQHPGVQNPCWYMSHLGVNPWVTRENALFESRTPPNLPPTLHCGPSSPKSTRDSPSR